LSCIVRFSEIPTLKRHGRGDFTQFKELGSTRELNRLIDIGFANLASFGAGDSEVDGYIVVDEVKQVAGSFIASWCDNVVNQALFGQEHCIVGHKKGDIVALLLGRPSEL